MITVADKPISESTEPAIVAATNIRGIVRSEATRRLNATKGPTIHQAFIAPNYSYGEPRHLSHNGPQRLVAAPIESEYPGARRPDVEVIKSAWRKALAALSALKVPSVAHTIPAEFPERIGRDILKDAVHAWVGVLREFDHIEHVVYTEGNNAVTSVIREVLDEGKDPKTERVPEGTAPVEPTPPVDPEPAERPPAETAPAPDVPSIEEPPVEEAVPAEQPVDGPKPRTGGRKKQND